MSPARPRGGRAPGAGAKGGRTAGASSKSGRAAGAGAKGARTAAAAKAGRKPAAANSHWSSNQVGVHGRLFADPQPGPDETAFMVDNTSGQYYESPYYKLHKNQIQPIPPPSSPSPRIELADILGAEAIKTITDSGKIAFHAVGDTGAAKVNVHQTAEVAIEQEGWVADAMSRDVRQGGPDAPCFFFHLGDVVYDFGEAEYYYDQFYEPFRGYDAPIFAIPGNHDGGVKYGEDPNTPLTPTLMAFRRNFCAPSPEPSPDANGLARSTMTQPGVYFTLDAPYVSIVGLYTNVLDEGPGVISSQGGRYPIGDEQLQFLTSELQRIGQLSDFLEKKRALIVACHHPPASLDAAHGGALGLAEDIATACKQAQVWPHAVLSGHAHLYQRFTRNSEGHEVPYVVAGSGGYAATPPRTKPKKIPLPVGEFTLEIEPVVEFGYLTVTVDTTVAKPTLTIAFRSVDGARTHDEMPPIEL
ncbi:MAG TPA: metallophosphoesterase [Solirubrobacteraceae bacterium]|nr:metallophosphoesterase [Solirubrobacteraceae bacterium]